MQDSSDHVRCLTRFAAALALAVLAACGAPSRAARPAAPAPATAPAPSTVAHAKGRGDSLAAAEFLPQGATKDSIDRRLTEAISLTSAIFGVPDSVARGTATMIDVDSTSMVGDGGTSWDIDVESYVTQQTVARYVDLFLGSARERFVSRLQRGKRWEPMIRSTLRAHGIPEDMYFLALVESGFDPHAYSSAAAVGMWQFMATTGRGVGLRVDWWVDERRDPIRSTIAAARFIGDLRDQFGSLYLAAAAYNGGPGRVSRGLKKYDEQFDAISGEDCFFALAEQDYLRAETKNYVPQLIAAALLGKNPARYGIRLDSVAPFAYDSVRVPEGTPLAAVAKAIGMTLRDVTDLNSHFLRGLTPPGDSAWVRLPVGKGEGFAPAFEALPDGDRLAFTRVESRKGETMATIAARAGIGARQLAWYNRDVRTVRKTGRLVPGQLLLVPSEMVAAGALDIPDPSIERYGSAARGRTTTHVVRRGESLGSIARRYRTSVSSLVSLNRLKKRVIYPGQTIIVKGAARASRSAGGSSGRRSTASKAKSTGRSAKSSKSKAGRATTARKKASAKSATKKPAAPKKQATGSKR